MTHSPLSRPIAALTPHIRGTTIELTGPEPGLLAGTTSIRGADGTDDWGHLADDSVDAIVALGAPDTLEDPIGEIQQWCRVLREGGTLALVAARPGAPSWLISLIQHVGGLEIVGTRAIEPDAGQQSLEPWLLVAERRAVAEVRYPLGTMGPRLAEVASRDRNALAELYFQFGTILLQAGDSTLAGECFSKLHTVEGRSADGLFGRGMCHASAERWTEARIDLEQAHQLQPDNDQITRWLTLAKSKVEASSTANATMIQATKPATKPQLVQAPTALPSSSSSS